MPTTPRRSSQGGRRAEKAHRPYRGDQPGVGKRTGVLIHEVQRQSDGFEDFGDVLEQHDPRTPPLKNRRKKSVEEDIDIDEDGEKSMDIDESPLHYIQTSKPASNSRRVGTSSRPVARTSDVDFDEVPSPRAHSIRGQRTPRPSRLSQTIARGDFFDDETMDDPPPVDMDMDESPPHTSFQEMDRDDDDEDDDLDTAHILSPVINKNKGKARADEDVEDDIVQALDNIEPDINNDQPPSPKKKKKKKSDKRAESAQPTMIVRRIKQKENRDIPDGVRRSNRVPIEPLAWWRGEKVVYGRTTNQQILVPQIKEIHRIAVVPEPPLTKKKAVARKRKRADSADVTHDELPEKGWDDKTSGFVEVLSYPDGEVKERQIAYTERMIRPGPAVNNPWLYQRLFGDGQYMAAGQLVIPPKERKQPKRTKDNTFVFYVIQGAINLKVHEASMVLCTGAAFMVPRGNVYFIENIGERDAKLFFSQARMEPVDNLANKRRSSVRKSSVTEESDGPSPVKRAPSRL